MPLRLLPAQVEAHKALLMRFMPDMSRAERLSILCSPRAFRERFKGGVAMVRGRGRCACTRCNHCWLCAEN